MSEKQLKMAARMKVPKQLPDLEAKIVLMVMADRADDTGTVIADDHAMDAVVHEVNAMAARLRGDPFVRSGVDNERVNRVVAALREAEDRA